MPDLDGMYEALESQRRILRVFWRVYPVVIGLNVMVVVSGGEVGWFAAWGMSVVVCSVLFGSHWRQCRAFSRAERGEG